MNSAMRCILIGITLAVVGCANQPRVEPKPIVRETGDLFKSENVERIVKGMPKQEALSLVGVPPMMILPSAGIESYSWTKTSQSLVYGRYGFRPVRGEFPTTESLVISFKNGKVDQKIYNKHQMKTQIRSQ